MGTGAAAVVGGIAGRGGRGTLGLCRDRGAALETGQPWWVGDIGDLAGTGWPWWQGDTGVVVATGWLWWPR